MIRRPSTDGERFVPLSKASIFARMNCKRPTNPTVGGARKLLTVAGIYAAARSCCCVRSSFQRRGVSSSMRLIG
jgi:hypothetical protein